MATLTRLPLYIRFDAPNTAVEIVSTTPKAPRGCDVRIELAVFYNSAPLDLSNVSSLHFEIAAGEKPTSTRLVSKVIAAADFAATSIEKAAWVAHTAAHAIIDLTGDELNPDIGSATSKNYFVILSGITTAGTRVAYGKGTFTIFEDGTSDTTTTTSEVSTPTYLTTAQVQALITALRTELAGSGTGTGVDYTVTALVGATAGCLDAVATAALSKPLVKLFLVDGALRAYSLANTTDAADGDKIVRPADYNASTNPYQWVSCL